MKIRRPWGVAFVALAVGAVLAYPRRDEVGFASSLVATYVGAAIGFFVALYIDRIQRAEDAENERKAQIAQAAVDKAARLETERERRVAVMSLLREELAPIPKKMGGRQERATPPSTWDRLSDTLWRAFSSSGEIRWLTDLDLLRKLASAYELVGVEAGLEDRWRQAIGDWGVAGRDVTANAISSELKSLDRDTWRLVCDACKSLDAALVQDGAAPGSNSGDLFCPY